MSSCLTHCGSHPPHHTLSMVSVTHREGTILFVTINEAIGVAMFRKYASRKSPRAPVVSIKIFAVLLSSITLILIKGLLKNYDLFGHQHIHNSVQKVSLTHSILNSVLS
jgi:hypothetical protein